MELERRPGFPGSSKASISWLGQAGFWVGTGRHGVLIDPYLSDSLARKYAGTRFDHQRMMPAPIEPDALPRPDLVLITHAHTDHMDPDTLAPLAKRFPDLPFVVPRAKADVARDRIGTQANLVEVTAGDILAPLEGLDIRVFPAAHEVEERDAAGNHVFLGYGLAITTPTGEHMHLYHSGDTIPFASLTEAVVDFAPDIALLPVNGRDATRLSAGIPGNMTLEEAVALCRDAGAECLIPHHFGMFAFNTLDEEIIDQAALDVPLPAIVKPSVNEALFVVG